MNFFKAIFGSEESVSESNFPWIHLQELLQLDELTKASYKEDVLIFKHSTRCGISRFSLKSFETEFKPDTPVGLYFLDILKYRSISNEVASRFDIVHQSPQLLLIRNGKVVYEESHGQISASKVMTIATNNQ